MTQPTKDPVCGKDVDPLRARAVGIFGGVTYYFCSAECKGKFVDPRKTPREPGAARPEAKPAVLANPSLKAPPPKEAKKAEAKKPEKAPEPKPAPDDAAEAVARAAEANGEEPPPRLPRVSEPSAQVPIKVDPSPSVQAELEAARSGGATRAWLIVFVLFAIAGVVLFFALRK